MDDEGGPDAVLELLLDGRDDDAGAVAGAVDAGAVEAGAVGVAAGVGVADAFTYAGGSNDSFGCPSVATFI